jgi:hypothetical protein
VPWPLSSWPRASEANGQKDQEEVIHVMDSTVRPLRRLMFQKPVTLEPHIALRHVSDTVLSRLQHRTARNTLLLGSLGNVGGNQV